jgi:hypothetical protein
VTGYPDSSTSRKKSLGELFECFCDEESGIRPPVKMWWMFGITSNIFSTSCSIIVSESDKDTLAEWLTSEFGYTLDDLDYMFS